MRLPRFSPHQLALLVFLAAYTLLVLRLKETSHRDPSSLFFDPERAFQRNYSLDREAEAEEWILNVEPGYVRAFPDPTLCIGIPTVQRGGGDAQYFRHLVGSLLAGLTLEERKDLFLVTFFADLEPGDHQAFGEEWVYRVVDEVITYKEAAAEEQNEVRELVALDQSEGRFDRKPLFDYVHVLKHCLAKGTPYIAILEDDAIAAEGWFYHTILGLSMLEDIGEIAETLYLRLFYNERILGWNSEEWLTYLLRALAVEALVLSLIMTILRYLPSSGRILTPATVATVIFLLAPMSIGLYFAAGRLTVSPLPRGLNRMNTFGCCSQALVFPRAQVPALIDYYEGMGMGKIDSLTELYANAGDWDRWALTPSLFAHVGSKSSKVSFETKWGRSNTENIWNFGFEEYRREDLREDHLIKPPEGYIEGSL